MQVTEQYSYQQQTRENGALYLVGTPIGNLEDMTFRAVRILREADIIAAEDTRETRKLMNHFKITKKILYSYHEHNKQASGPELVRIMKKGKRIALVSDAGLPAISDPGVDLVRLTIEASLPVIPIPGPNAALLALIASGLPTNRFIFVGFLPRGKKHAELMLASLKMEAGTLVMYESPYRIVKTLKRLATAFGDDRRTMLARELTKRYEHFIRGTVRECITHVEKHPLSGECCILVEGASKNEAVEMRGQVWWKKLTEEEHVTYYELEQGISRKEAMKLVAKDRGVSRRDIYKLCCERG